MPGGRISYRVERQRFPQRLSKLHQLLHVGHPSGGLARRRGRYQQLGTRLVALSYLVEGEDHGEDDECGKELQPPVLVDLVCVRQGIAERARHDRKEGGPHPEQQEQIIALDQAHGTTGVDNRGVV